MASNAQFQIFKGADGSFRWHLLSGNGEIVAQSEGYKTREHVREGIDGALAAFAATTGDGGEPVIKDFSE